ncbi:MAG: substrate-binding domain-containing protein [Chloroflexi bacterium]|nr:substrate-binding domain-containing protein [Chloroflexota bacterium]MBP8059537.1 substrate-binding domain-containing protein [Chloroflexota bacterium]
MANLPFPQQNSAPGYNIYPISHFEFSRVTATLINGSSTVGPITQLVATTYQATDPTFAINVAISGTGGGFRRFCAGETDISDASRPIKESEAAECASNGITYIELPVAFDGLAVLVNPAEEGMSRPDFWASEDDALLVKGINDDPNALGFFGLAYKVQTFGRFPNAIADNVYYLVSYTHYWVARSGDRPQPVATDQNANFAPVRGL